MRQPVRATIRHHSETWNVRLGQQMSGKDAKGGRISSRAVVLGINVAASVIETAGSAEWGTHAQVHDISDVEYDDVEIIGVGVDEVSTEIETRAAAGWRLRSEVEFSIMGHPGKALLFEPAQAD